LSLAENHCRIKGHLGQAWKPYEACQRGSGDCAVATPSAHHKIKARSNLGATDKTIIYSDGKVTDANGCEIGNIHDEV